MDFFPSKLFTKDAIVREKVVLGFEAFCHIKIDNQILVESNDIESILEWALLNDSHGENIYNYKQD